MQLSDDQLSIFDALAALDAKIVMAMVPEPGYAWYQCRECGEFQYKKRLRKTGVCIMTPYCRGVMLLYLERRCEGCGKALTRRSRDGRYCNARCRSAA